MTSPRKEDPRVPKGTGTRRSAVVVEAERRSTERKAKIGGEVREMRKRRGWTQARLGREAEVGRLVIGRIERGVGPLDLETLDRIAVALGVPIAAGFDRDPQVEVADAGHLGVQEIVLRMGRATGYGTQFELPTRPNEPWRSADVVLAARSRGLAILAECWNTFGDIGAATRSSRRKLVELDQLAAAMWGPGTRAVLVWVVRDTSRNRALVGRYPAVFASTFSGSSHAWVNTLANGAEPPSEPGLVWCDSAAGALRAWHRPRGSQMRRAQRSPGAARGKGAARGRTSTQTTGSGS